MPACGARRGRGAPPRRHRRHRRGGRDLYARKPQGFARIGQARTLSGSTAPLDHPPPAAHARRPHSKRGANMRPLALRWRHCLAQPRPTAPGNDTHRLAPSQVQRRIL